MPSSKTVLAQGKYLQLVKEGTWEYVHRICGIGAAAIIAVTKEQELLLVEQYRVPFGKQVIDLPAGLVGDDDADEHDFEEAARRELLEETGYAAGKLKLVIAGPTSSGLATEVVHFYLGKNVKKVSDGGGVEGENITVHVIPVSKVLAWFKRQAKAGKLIDAKAYLAASWVVASAR
ncbi:NUDIX hydrolase [Planctomicrobium piriforme]|uniref:GDP-mannose pyrophosphatase n=1 Tax=Planctomicrobium piriforme TaxID=1576369 RepID=A0A1I3CGA0_9PLAN|nr:NUDIX hydrolase [Planctomicrobium piriforme]SFH73249.1 ADP-ribose pyrophosphatase [Planctomicrobium piriforme]